MGNSSCESHDTDLTVLLRRARDGDREAFARAYRQIVDELRPQLLHWRKRSRPDPMVNTTAVLDSAYRRLIDAKDATWQDRGDFIRQASKAIRRILVDFERKRRALKRGGDRHQIPLGSGHLIDSPKMLDHIILNDAIERLSQLHPVAAEIFQMNFFAEQSVGAIATHLGLTVSQVSKELRFAKAWLRRELDEEKS